MQNLITYSLKGPKNALYPFQHSVLMYKSLSSQYGFFLHKRDSQKLFASFLKENRSGLNCWRLHGSPLRPGTLGRSFAYPAPQVFPVQLKCMRPERSQVRIRRCTGPCSGLFRVFLSLTRSSALRLFSALSYEAPSHSLTCRYEGIYLLFCDNPTHPR